jgi:cob(I)alamin adenosyltransferase
MSFYTRTGDDGTTGLLGEDRVSKHHPRIEALGALDEASAAIGLARASCLAPETPSILRQAQRDLYKLMTEVAAAPENAEKFQGIGASQVSWLEEHTDRLSQSVSMPKAFILPGDTPSGAALSLARAVVRRAERRVTELFTLKELRNEELLHYLNRLSSLCFVLELVENRAAGQVTSMAKEQL